MDNQRESHREIVAKFRKRTTLPFLGILLLLIVGSFFMNDNLRSPINHSATNNPALLIPYNAGKVYKHFSIENPEALESAISNAIKEQGKNYFAGDYLTEGHMILGIEKKDNNKKVTVYTVASVGWFSFENGFFTKISGTGAVPTVMTFAENNLGAYELLTYREPEDGSNYAASIKKMFPEDLQELLFTSQVNYLYLDLQQEAQAKAYLQSIGSTAEVNINLRRPLPL
ncbi:hypothetical protein F9B85_06565 [Heliorestis acidaminivorans]|uniref:Uncharacterized protein n=1 Tax=Heliorestis acidaminivorans TaxID=553427 RepID=A0A6I0ERE4_9FIRM|nr:hypothetical protein [Heliorestis acidaminivorans]KAB2952929.1 hypothetical protein F9B85_06565 [Heliorestis acidaminivorans]